VIVINKRTNEEGLMDDQLRSPDSSNARKLLIVDDNDQIRHWLSCLGEKLGLDIAMAGDGESALGVFKDCKPDLVIMDIYMPHMNGILAMHKIKEMDPDCPVILITGYGHYQQLIQSKKVQPDGFILKPFKIQAIADKVLTLLDKRENMLRGRDEEFHVLD
jgi:DNA-binding NtrC family response regulator